MKVAIGGYGSSGKSTVGAELAKALHIKHIDSSYKSAVANDSELILKMQELIKEKDKSFAQKFDRKVIKMAAGDCVISTWLGSWLVKGLTARIWINASIEERARRRSKLNGLPYSKELALLKKYDKLTHDHFKQVYGIDVYDHSIFDMELNSEKLSINEMVTIISSLAKAREKKR